MADTGLVYPGTIVSASPGEQPWINLVNAQAATVAVAELADDLWDVENTEYAHATNFGLAALLPSGCTIDGIVVDHKASKELSDMNGKVAGIQAIVSGSRSGSILSSGTLLTTTLTTRSVGTSLEKWGISPTRAMLVASDFGFSFRYKNTSDGVPGQIYLDYVRIRVYYTAGASVAPGFHPVL